MPYYVFYVTAHIYLMFLYNVSADISNANETPIETNIVVRRWKIYLKHVSCNDKSCIKTIKGLSKEDKKCATHPKHLFI